MGVFLPVHAWTWVLLGTGNLLLDDYWYVSSFSKKQEHPRGSIVEPQGYHQDALNSLSYNGLKTPIIIAHFILQKNRN